MKCPTCKMDHAEGHIGLCVEALLADVEELKRERDAYKGALTHADACHRKQSDRADGLLSEIEDLRRENNALRIIREERPNLQAALRKAETRADALRKELTNITQEHDEAVSALAELMEKYDAKSCDDAARNLAACPKSDKTDAAISALQYRAVMIRSRACPEKGKR